MQTNYISVSAEQKRYDNWQRAATVMKRVIIGLNLNGKLSDESVRELFSQFQELRVA